MLILSTLLLLILTLVLGEVFSARLRQEGLQSKKVIIYPENKDFIRVDEVKKMLQIRDSATIDMSAFEASLEKNNYISKAEVYRDLNGNLVAEVTQYKPIARVFGATSYYIDEQGKKRPLSHHYTENVVLIYGDVNQKQRKKLVAWIKQIYKDKLLNNIVSEIHLKSYGYSFKIKNFSGNFILNNTNPEEQLYKLKNMYAYLDGHKLQNKYYQIDLRYNKQVVCK